MRLIVFDLDGTLVDTMEAYAEKASELIERFYGVPRERAKRMYLETSGMPFLYQLNEMFPEKFIDNVRVARMFENWKKIAFVGVRVDSNVREFLKELKEEGYILAVSSNNVQELVEKFVKGCPFDYVLGWDWANFTKGEPHFYALERSSGIPRKEFLFVGDSERDRKVAEECGVRFLKTSVSSLIEDLSALLRAKEVSREPD